MWLRWNGSFTKRKRAQRNVNAWVHLWVYYIYCYYLYWIITVQKNWVSINILGPIFVTHSYLFYYKQEQAIGDNKIIASADTVFHQSLMNNCHLPCVLRPAVLSVYWVEYTEDWREDERAGDSCGILLFQFIEWSILKTGMKMKELGIHVVYCYFSLLSGVYWRLERRWKSWGFMWYTVISVYWVEYTEDWREDERAGDSCGILLFQFIEWSILKTGEKMKELGIHVVYCYFSLLSGVYWRLERRWKSWGFMWYTVISVYWVEYTEDWREDERAGGSCGILLFQFIEWSILKTGEKMKELGVHDGACGPFVMSGYGGYKQVRTPKGKLFAFDAEGQYVLTCSQNRGLVYKVSIVHDPNIPSGYSRSAFEHFMNGNGAI